MTLAGSGAFVGAPGPAADPLLLRNFATYLADRAGVLEVVGRQLAGVDSPEWIGPAADQFRETSRAQAVRWRDAADSFRQAGSALNRYADVLEWAQRSQIDAYNRHAPTGQAASSDSPAESGAQNLPIAMSGIPTVNLSANPDFVAAVAAAQSQVNDAGAEAARLIESAARQAPAAPVLGDDGAPRGDSVTTDLVNEAASIGNAILNNPGLAAAVLGGAALTAVSAAGVAAGAGLSASGVGAVGGVPLTGLSAAGIATGLGIAGVAAAEIARNADGPDRVEPAGGAGEAPAEPQVMSPGERLGEVYRRLDELPSATTADEALNNLNRTLDEVEDEHSGVPKNPNPGLAFDGRMYPPREDFIERTADGGLIATTKGNEIHISPDGELRILSRRTGEEVYRREGGG